MTFTLASQILSDFCPISDLHAKKPAFYAEVSALYAKIPSFYAKINHFYANIYLFGFL